MDNGFGRLLDGLETGVIGAILAALFGWLQYAQEFLASPPPQFRWLIFTVKGATAAAAGYLVTEVLLEFNVIHDHPYLSGVLISLAGWGGPETLNAGKEAAFDYLRKRVGRAAEISEDRDAAR